MNCVVNGFALNAVLIQVSWAAACLGWTFAREAVLPRIGLAVNSAVIQVSWVDWVGWLGWLVRLAALAGSAGLAGWVGWLVPPFPTPCRDANPVSPCPASCDKVAEATSFAQTGAT